MAGKRIALGFLFLLGIMVCCPKAAAAERQFSGTCGPSATWSVNPETKVLTIRGTGAITERIPLRTTNEDYLIGNPYVEQIVIEEGITSIEEVRPFIYLECTKEIFLPNSLRKISDAAFFGLSRIKSITIPKGVNEIGKALFVYNLALEEIIVESGNAFYCSVDHVLYTKDQHHLLAFPANKKVQDGVFVVPEAVREIAPLAFVQQKRVREVVLPKSLQELGGGAFFGCGNLEKINLQETRVSELPDFNGKEMGLPGVNANARNEEPVDIQSPEDTSYYWGTFAHTAIQTLILPDSIQEISGWCILYANIQQLCLGKDYIGSINAFQPENNIGNLDDQYNVGNLCLYNLPELKEIKVAEGNSRYTVKDDLLYSKDGTIVYGCPYGMKKLEVVLDKTVRQIAPYAFYRKTGVLIVTCQGSLVSIGEYAFYYSSIEEFWVNGNVGYIEKYAFYQSELEEFSTLGNVYSVGNYAFHSCEYLDDADLQIGGRLYEMTPTAFFHYISMQRMMKIYVPDSFERTRKQTRDSIDAVVEKWKAVQEIYNNQNNQCGESAYWRLEGNSLVVYGTGSISEKINLLEEDAEGIRRLVIEEGITDITEQKVFADLYDLRYVELPESLETIAAFAFAGVTQMSKIQIPKNVNQIGEGAFYGVFCLRKIQVDPDNKVYVSQDGVLFSRDMRTLVQFPGGKDSVNSDSDWNREYRIPDTVTEIGPLSFAGTYGLRKVILPETLRILGGGAFYDSYINEINLQDTQVTELPAYNGWKWKVRDHFHKGEEQPPEEEVYYYWGTFEYSRLYHLFLPDGVKEISSVCFRNSMVRKITLGASYCGSINQRKLSWESYEGEESAIKYAQDNLAESILLYSNPNSLLLSQSIQEGMEVDISKHNPYYQIKNGVIYNRKGTIAYGLSSHIRVDVVLEETVKEIAPAAFWGEAYLQTVSVPGDLQSIGVGAFAESGLREIRVNGRVHTIETGAFAGSGLTCFDSGGISGVEDYAFAHTYLSAIDLGKEVQSIGKGVFRDCYALQTVSFDGTILFLAPDLFSRCPSLWGVLYPSEALAINSCLKASISLY